MVAGRSDKQSSAQMIQQTLYISRAVHFMQEEDLGAILTYSRESNSRHAITGLLLYGSGHFYQILEGSKANVHSLLERIRRDNRHVDLTVIAERDVEERVFPKWWMGFRSLGPSEFADDPAFHNIRTASDLLKIPGAGDKLFKVMYAMYTSLP
jgi:hypothetical protein